MRIVFMGTPEFARAALDALADSRHELSLVVTQPDRPAGRGKKLVAPPVKVRALELGIEVFQPEKINTRLARSRVAEAGPDLIVVVAFGQILRPLFLALAPLGCLNVHASLLPRHRGASPINAQIIAGDPEVGVTIMRMETGLDTGPAGLRAALAADPRETAGELHDRLAPLGAELLMKALDGLEAGTLEFTAQDDDSASYAGLMKKADGAMDFRRSAAEIDRQVRGLLPWPGAYADLVTADGVLRLGILECQARPEKHSESPGTVLAAQGNLISVACGDGVLELLKVKPPGRRPMPTRDFLNGARLQGPLSFALLSTENDPHESP